MNLTQNIRLFFFLFVALALPVIHSAPLSPEHKGAYPAQASRLLGLRGRIRDWYRKFKAPHLPPPTTINRPPPPTLSWLLENKVIGYICHSLSNNEKKVFRQKIDGIEFGEQIQGGFQNYGMWNVKIEYEGRIRSDLIAKFFRHNDLSGWSEVKALTMVKLLVMSGKAKHPWHPDSRQMFPVIIMIRKEGKTYNELQSTPNPPSSAEMEQLLCNQVAKDALEYGILHELSDIAFFDNQFKNAIYFFNDDGSIAVAVVDYGVAYLVLINKKGTKEEKRQRDFFYAACVESIHRFKYKSLGS
ncbi:hypothetical protein FB446DRAFT_794726 [Lentinula raphanica]|nr:hypothetical protein FB446DRAFT_794726 [Lentinula raphanica]